MKSPSLDYSHFISLPLAIHTELVNKLQNFQNDILGFTASHQDADIDNDSNEDASGGSDDEGKKISVNLEVENEKERVKVKIDAADANCNTSKLAGSVLPGMLLTIFIIVVDS